MNGIDKEDLTFIAEKLSEDFSFYKGKKIFLTGGTGFFGKWLLGAFAFLNRYHKLDIAVTILSRNPKKFSEENPKLFRNQWFTFIKGDIRNLDQVCCVDENFDLIIHAATDASVELNKSKPELMYSTIIDGAKTVCDFAKKVKANRILYTSSGAAYGKQSSKGKLLEELANQSDPDKKDAYAYAKLQSENYFIGNAPCDVVITRCFAFSGPHLPLNGGFAFGNFINDVLNEQNIIIKSSGKSVRSYLYASDLVIWLLRVLSVGKDRELYNIGSHFEVTINKLATLVSRGCVSVKVLGVDDGNKDYYVPCTKKAERELGLKVFTSLEDSIEKTLRFYNKTLNK